MTRSTIKGMQLPIRIKGWYIQDDGGLIDICSAVDRPPADRERPKLQPQQKGETPAQTKRCGYLYLIEPWDHRHRFKH